MFFCISKRKTTNLLTYLPPFTPETIPLKLPASKPDQLGLLLWTDSSAFIRTDIISLINYHISIIKEQKSKIVDDITLFRN